MANTNNGRMLEFTTSWSGKRYRLYVKDGKPIRVVHNNSSYREDMFYPDNSIFGFECKQIVNIFFYNQEAGLLKKLYNSLDDGDLKSHVKQIIDQFICLCEKSLEILKS